ncbi:hypothetical protein ACS0TY_001261 [Phlomoides rotata]
MSTPMEYYNSLPPVTKIYAVACFMTTAAYQLNLYNIWNITLNYSDVFKRFQIWRLITPVFFLGPFSFTFAFRLLSILLYGVQLERGPFDKRTADLVWMYIFSAFTLLVIGGIPYFWSIYFTGPCIVYVIGYIWGREFPNARINVHGLFELKGFYMPWYMLTVDALLGNPLKQGFMGIGAAHLYYFLSVLYPLSSGTNIFKTPKWVHKLVAFWGEGFQMNSPFRTNDRTGVVFRGRSNRLDGARTTAPPPERDADMAEPPNSAGGVAFRGRSRRLGSSQ